LNYPPLIDAEFDELVLSTQVPVIIYLTTARCPISKISRREFRAVAVELQHRVAIFEVDALSEKVLVSRLGVRAVPTLMLFVAGTESAALLGFYHRDELRIRLWSIIPDRA